MQKEGDIKDNLGLLRQLSHRTIYYMVLIDQGLILSTINLNDNLSYNLLLKILKFCKKNNKRKHKK